jgi:hypothetical protein
MPSSILNSDDGVISGTSGLKSSGGDDGVLVFQSKGTETARINTDKQIVAAAGTASLPALTTTGDVNTGIFFPAADTASIATGGTERMRINSSGRVGVGITPSAWSGAGKIIQFGNGPASIGTENSGDGNFLHNAYESPSGTFKYADSFGALRYQLDANNNMHKWYTAASGTADTNISWSERARITSDGSLLVGTTTVTGGGFAAGTRFISQGSGAAAAGFRRAENSGTNEYVRFTDGDDTDCGSIDVNATANTTAYNTSSDYRLKQNVAPMVGALEKVSKLKPCTWNWKHAPEVEGQGFIAHELAEVVPDCVTGEKDAVYEDGSINPQGVDLSFLVATLTAAIQELSAKNDALEARIAALEAVPGNE